MNVWQFWQDALAGKSPEAKEGDIHQGFYRTRRLDPVAIWQTDGTWYARIGTKDIRSEPDIADLFAQVCRMPVKHPDYKAKMEGAPWPDETALPPKDETPVATVVEPSVAGIGHNSGSTLDQIVADMAEWDAMARKLMAAGAITDQATADKMSDIATKFGEFEKAATAEHKAEKEPHLNAGRAVDAKWKPVTDKAARAKSSAKTVVGEWLKAEKARLDEAKKLAAQAAGVGEDVIDIGTARAGQKRAVVLKTRKVVEITDIKAASAYLAGMNEPVSEFVEVVRLLAGRLLTAGVEVPGAHHKNQQYAA
ncbi:hypothetical protein AB4037_23095 [Labrys sp. KB_33_2]|uniref:hypothetical protein n=1 Tax=Labrys sp. KB_33_2 TaxID=3237479 RepID=UPI003F915014